MILLIEHRLNKNLTWKVLWYFLGLGLFVSCFLAWHDEHHNTEMLKEEKSSLTSERKVLEARLEDKQNQIENLRNEVQVTTVLPKDFSAQLAEGMVKIERDLESVRNQPATSLKKRALALSKSILQYVTDRTRQSPDLVPSLDQKQWETITKQSLQFSQETSSLYVQQFSAEAVAVLNKISQGGIAVPAILLAECSLGTNLLSIKDCGTRIGALADQIQ